MVRRSGSEAGGREGSGRGGGRTSREGTVSATSSNAPSLVRGRLTHARRRKDVRSKTRNDPLTNINSLLSTSNTAAKPYRPRPHVPGSGSRSGPGQAPSDPKDARLKREQSERERALALIAKSKAPPKPWDDTPSTVAGGRSWVEDFEREKDRAGHRYFTGNAGGGAGRDRGWDGRPRYGRSWEV